MNIISIAIIIFIILEGINILILYFKPDSKLGNGVGVFKGFEESKKYPELHEFIKYLVYWVAGTKLIFIMLLLVILLTGTTTMKIWTMIALIISVLTYYWRLHPIIKKLDLLGEMQPKGYSKVLGIMIAGFIGIFAIGLIAQLIILIK